MLLQGDCHGVPVLLGDTLGEKPFDAFAVLPPRGLHTAEEILGRRGGLAEPPEDEPVLGPVLHAEILRGVQRSRGDRAVELARVTDSLLLDRALAADLAVAVALLKDRPRLGEALVARSGLRRGAGRGRATRRLVAPRAPLLAIGASAGAAWDTRAALAPLVRADGAPLPGYSAAGFSADASFGSALAAPAEADIGIIVYRP
jgi:hypothetical protein